MTKPWAVKIDAVTFKATSLDTIQWFESKRDADHKLFQIANARVDPRAH